MFDSTPTDTTPAADYFQSAADSAITPRVKNDKYTLYLGDCHDIVKQIPSGSVDLVCTDVPYFSTNLDFDKKCFSLKPILEESVRVLKPSGVFVTTCDLNMLIELRSHNLFKSSYELIWPKNQTTHPLDANIRPLRGHEFVLVMTNTLKKSIYNPQMTVGNKYKKNQKGVLKHSNQPRIHGLNIYDGGRFPLSVLPIFYDQERQDSSRSDKTRHPTQKPLDLISWLIKTYSNEGDTVLDPFMGSGTTGVACASLGRNFTGIEINPEYFDISLRRIADELSRPRMFAEPPKPAKQEAML